MECEFRWRFLFFDALCHGFSPGLIRSEPYGASLFSAYHRLKDVVFWFIALIVSSIHSYSLQGTDCLANRNCFKLNCTIYFYCILICLYNARLIIIFYYCFSVIVSLISFSAACSALDYHGTSRRLFVGLDNGTISVSLFSYICLYWSL